MSQTSLFDLPLSDPSVNTRGRMPSRPTDTQRAAAEAILPKTGTRKLAILDSLARSGNYGCTMQDLSTCLGMPIQSVCGRMDELRSGLWVKDSGRRRGSIYNRKLKVTVYVLTREGIERLDEMGLDATARFRAGKGVAIPEELVRPWLKREESS